mgnify:FL=1
MSYASKRLMRCIAPHTSCTFLLASCSRSATPRPQSGSVGIQMSAVAISSAPSPPLLAFPSIPTADPHPSPSLNTALARVRAEVWASAPPIWPQPQQTLAAAASPVVGAVARAFTTAGKADAGATATRVTTGGVKRSAASPQHCYNSARDKDKNKAPSRTLLFALRL